MALKVANTTVAGFNAWAEANKAIEIIAINVQGDNATVNVFYKELHVTSRQSPAGDRVAQQPGTHIYSNPRND